jgi:hypothetical protein
MSFGEIRDAVKNTIRDAVAHITPGMDLRIADYAAISGRAGRSRRSCATWHGN